MSTDCGEGRVCRDRACFPSSSLPECGAGGECAGGKVCNPATNRCEDCSSTLRCPNGGICRNGTCEAPQTSCNNDTPCLPTGRVCDLSAHICVGCSDAHPCPNTHLCTTGTCTPRPHCGDGGSCPGGMTCDTGSGICVSGGTVPLCGACVVDAECQGTGSKCLAFGGGNYCSKACTGTGQGNCPTGYACTEPSAGAGKQCVPAAGRCRDNCVVGGCQGSTTCDAQTGLCMGPKRLCNACSSDEECGSPTDKCLPMGDGGARLCSQDCDTSHVGVRGCPAGFTCRTLEAGVKQCLPTGAQCVVDPCASVHCTDTSKPVCDPSTGNCVECVRSDQCPATDMVCQQNVCVIPGACTNDQSCAGSSSGSHCCTTTLGQRCHQCCTSQHCSGSTPYCVANTCQSTQDPCASVSCTPPQTCNPATGQCESGGTITCQQDADCAADPTGATKCDPTYHFCYSPMGICLDASQCAPGQTCAMFCTGCMNTNPPLGYCPPGLICLPLLDPTGMCIGLGGTP